MVRLALAALLFLQPVIQAVELAPVDVLLTRVIPQDQAALATSGPEKGERLAKLQSDLSLVVEGLEGFASEEDAAPSLKRLRVSVDAPEQFKDRVSALDAAYRALAIVDYTWAKRLPEASCSPEASRARLLKSGALSSWLATLLGPAAEGADAAAKLDQASAATTASVREYSLLRAKVHKMTEALGSEKAVGSRRTSLYCRRAEAYEALSAANRSVTGPVSASRATAADDASGVFVLARKTADGLEVLGAATAIEDALVTDARLVDGEGLVVIRRGVKNLIPVRVERRDSSGLALLRASEPINGYTLAVSAPTKDDFIYAVGHPERTGVWTRTRGLVTSSDSQSFQTDAVIDVGMTGGAALTEDGRLAGVFVLRPARAGAESFDWPVAVSAPALKSWLKGETLTAEAAPVQILEAGSASILTTSRALGQSRAPGAEATEAGYEFSQGNVHARCMANCGDSRPSSGSSYSSNGGSELGDALGKAGAQLVEALIFQGIPALFRGIGSLFKSSPNYTPTPVPDQPKQKIVEKPKPPEPELSVTMEPAKSDNPNEVLFVLKVKANVKELKTERLSVAFTVSLGSETKKGIAITDSTGKAVVRITRARSSQSFDDLNDESVRHPTLTNASLTQGETLCLVALDGSIALGTLAVTGALLATPAGVPVSYGCVNAATGLVAGAGAYCLVTFGKEAMVQRTPPVSAPSYSPPAQMPMAIKKPLSADDAVRQRAAGSFGEVDDYSRNTEDASNQAEGNVAQGQPENPNEPPEDSDDKSKSVNSQSNLKRKLEALEDAEKNAVNKKTLPDGRIRYYGPEKSARLPGQTRGASMVTEYNPKTGDVRMWMETYDHSGNVIRVHPKMMNGQVVTSPHFPPTGSELAP